MKESLVLFKTAKLAKDKGFDVAQVKGYYTHGDIQLVLWYDSENYNEQKDFLAFAPTQSLLQKWLREEHSLHMEIFLSDNSPYTGYYYRVMTIGQYFTT